MSLFPVIASSVGVEMGTRVKNVTTLPIGEEFWSYVTLLVNGDDLVDHSLLANVCSVTGTANYTVKTQKYGTGSLYLNGPGNSFKIAANTTTLLGQDDDFTVEFWYQPISSTTNSCILGNWDSNTYTGSQSWCITYDNKNRIRATIKSDDGTTIKSTGYTLLDAYAWHHIAFVRSGTFFTLFVDGDPTGSFIFTGNIAAGLNTTTINGYHNGYAYITGYLDELRITKGIARYEFAFEPPVTFPVATGKDIPPVSAISPFLYDETFIVFNPDQIYIAFIGMGKHVYYPPPPVPATLFPMMFHEDTSFGFNLTNESFLQLGA
jgi:hypothetical protein